MYEFNDIKGNDSIVKNLKSAIFYNKISHAYIINAPKGFGKKLIANSFAKAVQCENSKGVSVKDVASCGHCVSCRTFDDGCHTDVIYVNASKGKSIGVDDIREQIGKNIELKPYKYRYKIFIVNNADTMTVQAQNALLKTIEEPPEYGLFILLSENYNNFLPTILSRCVMFKLKPLCYDIVVKYLKNNFDISDDEACLYASYSQGNIGKAVEILSSERFTEIRNMVMEFVNNFPQKDFIDIFSDVSVFEEYKEDIMTVMDILYLCYRDMIVLKCFNIDDRFVIQKDKKGMFKAIIEKFSLKQLFLGAGAVSEAKYRLQNNANFQMTVENLFFKLKEKR